MSNDDTKTRLLEAAGEEFAAKGFDLARVRAICDRAGANLAAVNYHFGDKGSLYSQVLDEVYRCDMDQEERAMLDAGGPPAQILRAFIHNFLDRVLSMNRMSDWRSQILLREMLEPPAYSDKLVQERIRPRFERLKGLMKRICPEADEKRLTVLVFSVIGQCLHYKMARTVSERLIGEAAFQDLDCDYLADHIANYCLAALGLGPVLDETGIVAARSNNPRPLISGEESPCTGSR